MHCEIVTAYAYSPKYNTYTVAAYVLESNHAGLPKSRTFKTLTSKCTSVHKDIATRQVVANIYDGNVRHMRDMHVTSRGRVSFERVNGFNF